MPADINVSAPLMYSDGISTVLSFFISESRQKNEKKAMVIKLQFM